MREQSFVGDDTQEVVTYYLFTRYVAGDITLIELKDTMEEVARHLMIIIQIWGPYRYTMFGRRGRCASLQQPRCLIESLASRLQRSCWPSETE